MASLSEAPCQLGFASCDGFRETFDAIPIRTNLDCNNRISPWLFSFSALLSSTLLSFPDAAKQWECRVALNLLNCNLYRRAMTVVKLFLCLQFAGARPSVSGLLCFLEVQ